MPILLTTPYNPGSLDKEPYTHVRMLSFTLKTDEQAIEIACVHGYYQGKTFVECVRVPEKTFRTFRLVDSVQPDGKAVNDYTGLVTKAPKNSTDSLYKLSGDELYQHLIDKGHYAGTVI